MKPILTGMVLLTVVLASCLVDSVPSSQLRQLNSKKSMTTMGGASEDGRVYMTKYRKMREKQIGDELNTRAQTERATGRVIQDNRSLNIKQKKKPIAIVNKKSISSSSSSNGGIKKLSAQMPNNMHQQQQQQQPSYMNMPNQFQPQQQQQQQQQFGSFQQSNGYNERMSTLSATAHPTAAHMSPFMQQMGGNPMQQMNPSGMDPFAMHQMLQQQQQMLQMGGGGGAPAAKPGSKSALQAGAKLSKNKKAGNNALREQRFKMAMDQDFLAKNPNVYKFIVATYGPEFQEQMMKSQMEKMIEMHAEQLQAKQAAAEQEKRKKEAAAAARRQQQQQQLQQQQQQQQRAQQQQQSRVNNINYDYDDEHMIDHQSTYSNTNNNNNNNRRVNNRNREQEEIQRSSQSRVRSRPIVPVEAPRVVEEAPVRARTSSRPSVSQSQVKPVQQQQQQVVDKETVSSPPRQQVVQQQQQQQPAQIKRVEVSHISDEDLIHSDGLHDEAGIHHDADHHDLDDHHDGDEHHEHDDSQSSQKSRSRSAQSTTNQPRKAGNRI